MAIWYLLHDNDNESLTQLDNIAVIIEERHALIKLNKKPSDNKNIVLTNDGISVPLKKFKIDDMIVGNI